jgi:hypothetical protein
VREFCGSRLLLHPISKYVPYLSWTVEGRCLLPFFKSNIQHSAFKLILLRFLYARTGSQYG